jgi:hypothetical protein
MADVVEVRSLLPHALGVGVDGVITLGHRVELVEVEDRVRGLIGAEESLDGDPDVAGGEVVAIDGEAEDGVVDGAEDPPGPRQGPAGLAGRCRRCGGGGGTCCTST